VFLAAFIFKMARGLDVHCGCFSTGSDAPAMSAGWYLLRDFGFFAVGAFLFYAVFLSCGQQRQEKESALKPETGMGGAIR
jgi:hypothetical protein